MSGRRLLKAVLLATTILGTPGLAEADPLSLTALGATVAGATASSALTGAVIAGITISATAASIIGGLVTAGLGFLGQSLLGQQNLSAPGQQSSRTREFNPHPKLRLAHGYCPLEGSVAFHWEAGGPYYVAYLLNSFRSDIIDRIEINDGQKLDFVNDGVAVDLSDPASDIYDMQKGARTATPPYGTFDGKEVMRVWIADGDHTQCPQMWLDEIGPNGTIAPGILKPSDIWADCTVVFVKFRYGPNLEAGQRWSHGQPPPLKFFGRWARLYDPRKDDTSGVPGAAGAHRPDDPTTWEWSDNPALVGLMAAMHEYGLGFPQEQIPIDQWAKFADDCDVEDGGVSEKSLHAEDWTGTAPAAQEIDSDAGSGVWTYNKGAVAKATGAIGVLDGVPVLRLFSTDTDGSLADSELGRMGMYVDLAEEGRRGDIEYLIRSDDTLGGTEGVDKYRVRVYAAAKGGVFSDGEDDGTAVSESEQEESFMPPTALSSSLTLVHDSGYNVFGGGGSSKFGPLSFEADYLSVVIEGGSPNQDHIEVGPRQVYTTSQASKKRFRCDGVLRFDNRELELLSPVLATAAAHLDTTDGLLGVRAGVWEAPTDSLSQPIDDEGELIGPQDAGFDVVRAVFIGQHREWIETDGPGYAIRDGTRVHALHVPLVSRVEQAARLEKIGALRAEPGRTFNGRWDGRESHRRLGDRVNFALPGVGRAASTYVIADLEREFAKVKGGLRLTNKMKLIEDLEPAYTWTAADFEEPVATTPPTQIVGSLQAPISVTASQQNYRSATDDPVARMKVTIVIGEALTEQADELRVQVDDGAGYVNLIALPIEGAQTTYVAWLDPALATMTYKPRAQARSSTLGLSAWVEGDPLTIVTPVLDYDPADYSRDYA